MSRRSPRLQLTLLSFVNLLNFLHRYIPSTVKTEIKNDLDLTDFETGLIFSSFIISYMFTCPLVGYLHEHYHFNRIYVMVVGGCLWSLATGLTGLCPSLLTMLGARILFGCGEAFFATLSAPVVSDLFPPDQRAMAMTVFSLTIPLGSAIGYGLAAILTPWVGWRIMCGLLALLGLLIPLLLLIEDPLLGGMDTLSTETLPLKGPRARPQWALYGTTVAGYVCVTFGIGGLSDWLPTYLSRTFPQVHVSQAGLLTGVVVLIGGLTGTLSGGLLASWLQRRKDYKESRLHLLLSAGSMCLGAVLILLTLLLATRSLALMMILTIASTYFTSWCNGPINSLIQNSVPARLRARATGISILLIHLLGDAISPSIIGLCSDFFGSLRWALGSLIIVFQCASVIWVTGAVFL